MNSLACLTVNHSYVLRSLTGICHGATIAHSWFLALDYSTLLVYRVKSFEDSSCLFTNLSVNI